MITLWLMGETVLLRYLEVFIFILQRKRDVPSYDIICSRGYSSGFQR